MCLVSGAHPRSRGENTCQAGLPQNSRGSSPLTRGKPSLPIVTPTRPRLIPAHAGKTRSRAASARQSAAHPRSRGENSSSRSSRPSLTGSSPLTRGKLTHGKHPRVRGGLIPAHAGKTLVCDDGDADAWAHPRSRGENAFIADPGRERDGSSPLTRGKLVALAIRSGIPGPSPLTRGKHRRNARGGSRPGLIPAHAGKTGEVVAGFLDCWAHPRSRGENIAQTLGPGSLKGSSPLTRGKRLPAQRSRSRRGLIPAHAGKT